MTREEILAKKAGLSRANLYGADLSRADLSRADLSRANLYEANLSAANLSGANLYEANLSRTDLSQADLYGANLSQANLYGANLYGANLSAADLSQSYLYGVNLSEANLSEANLSGANLSEANLSGAKNAALTLARTEIVPREGEVVGWKKCRDGVLVKLRVPADAPRSNATGRKCRAGWVEVIEVIGGEGGYSLYDPITKYVAGATVRSPKFDPNRFNECSTGIHFFLTREEAEAYDL